MRDSLLLELLEVRRDLQSSVQQQYVREWMPRFLKAPEVREVSCYATAEEATPSASVRGASKVSTEVPSDMQPTHLLLYGLASIEAARSPALLKVQREVELEAGIRRLVRKVYRRLAPPTVRDHQAPNPAPALKVLMHQVPTEEEQEYNDFYGREHLGHVLQVAEYLWGVRYQAVDGPPNYLVCYGMMKPGFMTAEAYEKVRTPWAVRINVPRFNRLRGDFKLIGHAEGLTIT